MVAALLVAGCGHFQKKAENKHEGTWDCVVQWTWDKEGEPVPCSAKQQMTCTQTVFKGTGTISIGDAQWSEAIEGTCFASEEELYGTRTSVKTVPQNEAALLFEKERLGGKTLSDMSTDMPEDVRVRIVKLTDTELEFVNDEGRTITCTRPLKTPN